MHKILTSIFILFVLGVCAKEVPAEGSRLNYRLIGFSWGRAYSGAKYKIEIADGHYDDAVQFNKNVIGCYYTGSNHVIEMVPSFMKEYTWCVTVMGHNKTVMPITFHHFSCLYNPAYDTNILRLRIIKPAKNIKNTYVVSDGAKAIYDLDGKIIWYLPIPEKKIAEKNDCSDLKVSPQCTLTYLLNDRLGFEINYNGDTLWRSPNSDSTDITESFHHELTKTQSGHYLTLGYEILSVANSFGNDKNKRLFKFSVDSSGGSHQKSDSAHFMFSTLVEFDKQNRIVWKWHFSDYFNKSDLNQYAPSYMHGISYDMHPNSFYFNEKSKHIFLSLRNESRIVEIHYPSGKVLSNFGEEFKNGRLETGNDFFNNQHSVSESCKRDLWIYNNNANHLTLLPKVVLLHPLAGVVEHLQKVWEYECTYEGLANVLGKGIGVSRGGNVVELPNSDIFVSMNQPFSKVFIVGRDKKEKWSGVFERFNPALQQWEMITQYKASVITGTKEIEKLIWGVRAE